MFELSDYLVGIYKVKDCTNSVTIKNEVKTILPQSQRILTQPPTDPNKTLLVPTATTTQVNPGDEENAPPPRESELVPHNDSTFSPPIESTAHSQALAIHNHSNNATITFTDQTMDVSCNLSAKSIAAASADAERTTQSSATLNNQSSINETFFKKPLPPPPQKATK